MPDALTDNHHSTLHAFFLAAKEGGYTEFELRGNMIRAAADEASVVPTDDTDFGIYGGTRSGEAPLRIAPSP